MIAVGYNDLRAEEGCDFGAVLMSPQKTVPVLRIPFKCQD